MGKSGIEFGEAGRVLDRDLESNSIWEAMWSESDMVWEVGRIWEVKYVRTEVWK